MKNIDDAKYQVLGKLGTKVTHQARTSVTDHVWDQVRESTMNRANQLGDQVRWETEDLVRFPIF